MSPSNFTVFSNGNKQVIHLRIKVCERAGKRWVSERGDEKERVGEELLARRRMEKRDIFK